MIQKKNTKKQILENIMYVKCKIMTIHKKMNFIYVEIDGWNIC